MLKKFKPRTFEDLAAILALYRPGPMQFIDAYIDRKDGKEQVDYIDSSLKSILESTYGIIVYQEQIMEIVKVFAGYDLGKADIFRRAISKKDSEILSQELNKFVVASTKNGYTKEVAIEVGKRIQAFANYGFNKSHAYSYAKISYALMYYKVHYPEIYFSYYINLLKSSSDLAKFEQEIKYFNLKVAAPSTSVICLDAISNNGMLQLGLNNIRGLDTLFKQQLYEYIQKNNGSLNEVIDKVVIPNGLSEKEVINLVASGIFSNYGYNEKSIIDFILSKDDIQDMDALFFMTSSSTIEKVENYDFLYLEKIERESLNLNIRYNSYDTYFNKLISVYPMIKRIDQVELDKLHNNFDVLVEILNVKEIRTKTDKLMAFMDVRVEGKEGSITVFPETYQSYYDQLIDAKGYALVNVTVINNGFSLQKLKLI